MKLETGKYYRTRDGRKVGPAIRDNINKSEFPWNVPHCVEYWYDENGKSCIKCDEDDLISEWTDEPQTGTLQELNVKPGDVVSHRDCSELWDVLEIKADTSHPKASFCDIGDIVALQRVGLGYQPVKNSTSKSWRIISRASTTQSPVRTVTRKEVVPGVYGDVKVHDPGSKYVRINIDAAMDHTAITAAIETLTAIKEAME